MFPAMAARPEVLFVCVHNAGRSQMAAGLLDRLGAGRVRVRSAGSDPAETINPVVVEAMAEVGIDVSKELPKPLSADAIRIADVVITMGCGDACPVFPGKRYEDWELADPAGRSVEEVRVIRDEIERRVEALLETLTRGDPRRCRDDRAGPAGRYLWRMESATAEPTVADVPDRSRFEITVEGRRAGFAAYERVPGLIAFTHTEIDPAYGGRGLGGELVSAALTAARADGLAILPFCPFVRSWIEKHPGQLDLVPAQYREQFGLPADA